MAKYETIIYANFDEFIYDMHQSILNGSYTASYEEGSDYMLDHVRVAVRVYERYSAMGSNRLSLNVTVIGDGQRIYVSAITSGGSQGMILKFNTFGEEAFLDKFKEIIYRYEGK